MLDLVGNPNCWFCHAQAHLKVENFHEHVNMMYIITVADL